MNSWANAPVDRAIDAASKDEEKKLLQNISYCRGSKSCKDQGLVDLGDKGDFEQHCKAVAVFHAQTDLGMVSKGKVPRTMPH